LIVSFLLQTYGDKMQGYFNPKVFLLINSNRSLHRLLYVLSRFHRFLYRFRLIIGILPVLFLKA